jgi:mRNA interferase MazF
VDGFRYGGLRMKIERYDIYWANLDPTIGSEINKTRPVVIVSDNLMNNLLKTVVACPLTSSIHPTWRSRIQINIKEKISEIAVDQIRSISKQRIITKIHKLSPIRALQLSALFPNFCHKKQENHVILGFEF